MACSHLCTCQFNWPMDTLGSRRDPVTSEKAWLDFAVRLLSREAVGRGKGQETVWGSSCKPNWWNSETGLPWKNPTSNPKDSKDILLKKYNALEKHLRGESRFPSELEEESRLWGQGKQKELFLMTSLTSLLGKVTGVHVAALDAKAKANKVNAEINQSLLQDIKTCLSSTLSEIENISSSTVVKRQLKRKQFSEPDQENTEPVAKFPKTVPSSPSDMYIPQTQHYDVIRMASDTPTMQHNLINQSSPLISRNNSSTVGNAMSSDDPSVSNPDMTLLISNFSKKLFNKHKDLKKRMQDVNTNSITRGSSSSSSIVLNVHSLNNEINSSSPVQTVLSASAQPLPAASPDMSRVTCVQPVPYVSTSSLSPDISLVTHVQPMASVSNNSLSAVSSDLSQDECIQPVASGSDSSLSPLCLDISQDNLNLLLQSSSIPLLSKAWETTDQSSDNNSSVDLNLSPVVHTTVDQNDNLVADSLSISIPNTLSLDFLDDSVPHSNIDFNNKEPFCLDSFLSNSATEDIIPTSGNINTETSDNDSIETSDIENICKSLSSRASSTDTTDSPLQYKSSDHGYSSDDSAAIDLDALLPMFSSEEQTALWEDDASSLLLDKFLNDLD